METRAMDGTIVGATCSSNPPRVVAVGRTDNKEEVNEKKRGAAVPWDGLSIT